MTGLKTDLQAWLESLGSFSATATRGDLADTDGRGEPMQVSR